MKAASATRREKDRLRKAAGRALQKSQSARWTTELPSIIEQSEAQALGPRPFTVRDTYTSPVRRTKSLSQQEPTADEERAWRELEPHVLATWSLPGSTKFLCPICCHVAEDTEQMRLHLPSGHLLQLLLRYGITPPSPRGAL